MIITVNGQRVRLEPEAQEFIEELEAKNGTPANEIVGAIINGQLGRF